MKKGTLITSILGITLVTALGFTPNASANEVEGKEAPTRETQRFQLDYVKQFIGLTIRKDIGLYLKEDMTDEEKEELHNLVKAHMEEGKAMLEEIKEAYKNGENTDDLEALVDEFVEENKNSLDAIDSYIDEDKTDEWEDFKAEFVATIEANEEHRDGITKSREEMRDRFSEKKQQAIDNTLERLERILSNLDEDKLEKIIENLSNRMTKIRDNVDSSQMTDEKKEEMNFILDEIEAVMDMYR